MATLILYRSGTEKIQSSVKMKTDQQVLALSWDPAQKPTVNEAEIPFFIFCNSAITPASFKHLPGPFIFIDSTEFAKADLEQLAKQNSGDMIITRLSCPGSGIQSVNNPIICGLISAEFPENLDFTSEQIFLTSLQKIYEELLQHSTSTYDIASNSVINISHKNNYPKPIATVVIPLYNGIELTKALWRSVVQFSNYSSLEYIFVDNCSGDGTREWLKTLNHPAKCILNEVNKNFAGACNQGARAADSDIVIFLNNDTEVTEGWFNPLVKILNQEPDVAAVGNKQIFPGTTRIHHAGIYIDLAGHPKHYLEGAKSDDQRINFRRECVAVTGSCFAVRKSEFLDAGGFSEQYKNGYEDIDLCLNFIRAGKKIVYTPDSLIYHHVSKSPGRSNHNAANWDLFCSRWSSGLTPDINTFLEQNLLFANEEKGSTEK